MVRTKKHFRSPSPSSSSSSSSDEEEVNNVAVAPSQVTQRGMGKQLHFHGGGKQLSVVGGGFRGGKQLQMAPQEESDESSSSSEEEDEKPIPRSGGKQLRVPGGKQLRVAPSSAHGPDDDEDDSEESEEEEEEKMNYRLGGGKQFGGKAFRGGKQLVRHTTTEMDDSDSSSEEEEEVPPPPTTTIHRGQGGGKQLRMPAPAESKKDESADDMEESSEEEEEEEPAPPPKAPTPPPPPKPADPEPEESSEEEEEEAPPKKRGRAPARRSTRTTRSKTKVVDSSSDEESSEEEYELDMETFDNNKLIIDDADREMLDKMPELEREAIFAERFEKLKADADMKKAMRDVKRKEKEQKKQTKPKTTAKRRTAPKKEPPKKRGRKAKKVVESESESDDDGDEDYEEGVPDTSGDAALAASMSGKRVSTRNLDAKGNKFKRAAALAKIRENRANKAKEDSDSDLDYGKDSDDSDDDYEETTLKPWQQKNRKTPQLQESSEDESTDERRKKETKKRSEDVDAEVEDFALVTIPRRRLIRWCNEPFFEEAVKHCYIRLGIGRDAKTQKACYRLCRIVGVESKKEYSFPPEPNQKPVTTDKWLKVSFGKNENMFKMITVSDHRPSAEDVGKYVSQLKTDRLSDTILLKKKAFKLRKRQDNLVNNYTYTVDDIAKLVTEKKKRNKKASNIGMEKTHIAIAVQAARDIVKEAEKRVEEAKVAQMEEEDTESADRNFAEAKKALDDATKMLEERMAEQNRILKDEEERIDRLKGSSKVQNWVKVNQRARLANQNADFLSYKEQLAKEKAEASAEPKFDPFARRKVKPKNLWEVGGKQSNDKAADAGAMEEEKKDSHPSEDAAKDLSKDKQPESIEAQKLDLTGQSAPISFDEDINIGDIANLGLGLKKPVNRTRKGISFADYQSRKEAGTL